MGKTARTPLYSQVADKIEGMIDGGAYPPGSRIPSVRRLSQQLSVSVSTVLEAYRLLESRRRIEARPQSGYYVRSDRKLPDLPERSKSGETPVPVEGDDLVLAITEESDRPGLVHLGAATPAADFLPIARLNRSLARMTRQFPGSSQEYDSLSGVHALRVMIARRMLEAGCSVSPDEIVTTAGATAAIGLCLRAVTEPGDTVVVESPTYYGLLEAIEALHLRAIEVATCPEEGIDLGELAGILERQKVAACALVPNYGNPLGHVMPDDKKSALVELLGRHGVPLVEDDAYGDLTFGEKRPRAVLSYEERGDILYCSSFSKTLAPGLRVGWTVPGRHLERVKRLKFSSFIATPTCTQMAVADFLEHGGFEKHLRSLRRKYRDLVGRSRALVGEEFPEGTRVTRPEGGHVLWVELPERVDSLELRKRANAAGVSVVPGPVFSPTRRYGHFIRLNCAIPWSDSVEHAIRTLGRMSRELAEE